MSVPLMVLAGSLVCLTMMFTSLPARKHAGQAPVHTRVQFSFTASGSYDRVAPLFGAHEERKWAAGWEPQFVHPIPANDQQGAVFLARHGQNSSVWTTTAFDLAAGHVQYVYVMNDALVTLIDIHVTRQGAEKTGVSVVYERTALTNGANDHVARLAEQDKGLAKEWKEQIDGYLERDRDAAQP